MVFYSRLFPDSSPAVFDEAVLIDLAEGMRFGKPRNIDTTPSGIVYFGQFIDHDLTRDETKLDNAGKKPPEETPNMRSPLLDLDSLYGQGQAERNLFDGDRFIIDETVESAVDGVALPPTKSDLHRPNASATAPDFKAALVDDRNDENL